MDGNGRWAESRGLSVAEGHRAGARTLRRVVEASIELGIETLVVYAFSTENWSRPTDEVADLMELLSETIDEELPDLAKQGVRTRFLGRRDRYRALARAQDALARGADGRTSTRCICGSPSTTGGAPRSRTRPSASSRTASSRRRSTRTRSRRASTPPSCGDVDLLIRTSGELRISNFLLWEAAYAELVFTDTLWPDFDASDLRAAVDAYAARRRRFGARTAS